MEIYRKYLAIQILAVSRQFYKDSSEFFNQFNLDVYKAVQERQWLEAEKDGTKYFYIVKKLTVKMQVKSAIKELEKFKEKAIEIMSPVVKTTKAL
jgi:hypothetical protein